LATVVPIHGPMMPVIKKKEHNKFLLVLIIL